MLPLFSPRLTSAPCVLINEASSGPAYRVLVSDHVGRSDYDVWMPEFAGLSAEELREPTIRPLLLGLAHRSRVEPVVLLGNEPTLGEIAELVRTLAKALD